MPAEEALDFFNLSSQLERSGLVWHPEIGDEVADRATCQALILVNNKGLTPSQLRRLFLWLPRMEQMIEQIEARQAIITHFGYSADLANHVYCVNIEVGAQQINASHLDSRFALGLGLLKLLQLINKVNFAH
jgi:hypothetical protein